MPGYHPRTAWPEPDDRCCRPALEHARRIRAIAADTHDPAIRAVMLDMADELESIWEVPQRESDVQVNRHLVGRRTMLGNMLPSQRATLSDCRSAGGRANARRKMMADTRAVTALEYALIGAAIAAVIAATVFILGTTATGMFSAVATAL